MLILIVEGDKLQSLEQAYIQCNSPYGRLFAPQHAA